MKEAIANAWEGRREAMGYKKNSAAERKAFLEWVIGFSNGVIYIAGEESDEAKQASLTAFLAATRGPNEFRP